jgi:hypothetical protein
MRYVFTRCRESMFGALPIIDGYNASLHQAGEWNRLELGTEPGTDTKATSMQTHENTALARIGHTVAWSDVVDRYTS